MGTHRLVHVYSAILSIVVWQRVNAQGKHPDAYAPTVDMAKEEKAVLKPEHGVVAPSA
jgi:hypothetical protein